MREILDPRSAQLPPPKLLAAARTLTGLSQRDLAAVAQIDRSSLSRYEAGASSMRVETMSDLIDVLLRHGIKFLAPTRELEMGVAVIRGVKSS